MAFRAINYFSFFVNLDLFKPYIVVHFRFKTELTNFLDFPVSLVVVVVVVVVNLDLFKPYIVVHFRFKTELNNFLDFPVSLVVVVVVENFKHF